MKHSLFLGRGMKALAFLPLSAALALMPTLPATAQEGQPQEEAPVSVKISGSLIDWYYYGYDADSDSTGWHRKPMGGRTWTDSLGYHSTGAPNYGMFSMTLSGQPAMPLLPQFAIRDTLLYSDCGGVFTGGNDYYSFMGHIIGAVQDSTGMWVGGVPEIDVRHWTWDSIAPDGTYLGARSYLAGRIYQRPVDLAYFPQDDIVYGIFEMGSDGGCWLGTLDMETFEIKYVSNQPLAVDGLRTLACDATGRLFGTDVRGNIYEISASDASLQRIGNMGFETQGRMMSATIDYRTGKMYWLGYLNNGLNPAPKDSTDLLLSVAQGGRDTGLYEIDTSTGKATRIGKTNFFNIEYEYDEDGQIISASSSRYGKMQMTGIFVEGSYKRPDYDLRVTLKDYPEQMVLGQKQSGVVTVSVKNIGSMPLPAYAYTVSLYADDQLVSTIDANGEEVRTDSLAPKDTRDFAFYYNAPEGQITQTVKLSVVVSCLADQHTANNIVQGDVRLMTKTMLPVPELRGNTIDLADGTRVDLMWMNPFGRYTEDVEDYLSFSYDNFGAWIVYDGDKGYTQKAYQWKEETDYPHWGTPKAFMAMNPWKAEVYNSEKFAPHSGEQYFAAFWTARPDGSEEGGHQIANDDWLISPLLNSKADQVISFWARGCSMANGGFASGGQELMRVLATKEQYETADDFNADDWEVITDVFPVSNDEWTQYKATIPAGYQHFALHCCSQEGNMLMLDDITFTIPVRSITGYNIYVNGRLVGRNTAETRAYTYTGITTPTTFTITAIYDRLESKHSNVFFVGKKMPGDVNGDFTVDVADIASIITVMAKGAYSEDADVNGDQSVDVADIATVITCMSRK